MTVRVKVGAIGGGSWRDVASGGIHMKSGSAWAGASKCRVKIGDKGGGYWYDSGYVGYPNPPQSFGIPAWDFANITTTWAAPAAGGAPVAYFQVVKTDQYGNWSPGYNPNPVNVPGGAGATSYTFGVVEDERCQLYVRTISTAGLASGWAGPLRVQVGHTEINHQQANTGTRAWRSGAIAVNLWNVSSAAVGVPGNVSVDHFIVNLGQAGVCSGQTWTYLSPGTTTVRNIFFVTNDTVRRDIGRLTLLNPSNGQLNISGGGGGGWGLYAEGAGYATTASSSACRVVGDLEVFGTETYTYYTTVIDRARAENTTW